MLTCSFTSSTDTRDTKYSNNVCLFAPSLISVPVSVALLSWYRCLAVHRCRQTVGVALAVVTAVLRLGKRERERGGGVKP